MTPPARCSQELSKASFSLEFPRLTFRSSDLVGGRHRCSKVAFKKGGVPIPLVLPLTIRTGVLASYFKANTADPTLDPAMKMSTLYVPVPMAEAPRLYMY
jgi:hypothetical protein